jgi:hypothetical protein
MAEDLSLTHVNVEKHTATTIIHVCTKRLQDLRSHVHCSAANMQEQKQCIERAAAVLTQQHTQTQGGLQEDVAELQQQHGNHVTYSAVVALLVASGKSEAAVRLMRTMQRLGQPASVQAYHVTIGSFAREGGVDAAFKLFEEMLGAGVDPSSRMLTTLINACREKAIRIASANAYQKKAGSSGAYIQGRVRRDMAKRKRREARKGGSVDTTSGVAEVVGSSGDEGTWFSSAMSGITEALTEVQAARELDERKRRSAKRGTANEEAAFTCELCNVTVRDESQLEMHRAGKTHRQLAARAKRIEAQAGRKTKKSSLTHTKEKLKAKRHIIPQEVRWDLASKVRWIVQVAMERSLWGSAQGQQLLDEQLVATAVGVLALEVGDIDGALALHQEMGGYKTVGGIQNNRAFGELMHACSLAANIEAAKRVLQAMRESSALRECRSDDGGHEGDGGEAAVRARVGRDDPMLNQYALSNFIVACGKAEAKRKVRWQRKFNKHQGHQAHQQYKMYYETEQEQQLKEHQYMEQQQKWKQQAPRSRYLQLAEGAFADWCVAQKHRAAAAAEEPTDFSNGSFNESSRGSSFAVCNTMVNLYVRMGLVEQAFELSAAMLRVPTAPANHASETRVGVDSATLKLLVEAMQRDETKVLSVCQHFCDRREIAPAATTTTSEVEAPPVANTATQATTSAALQAAATVLAARGHTPLSHDPQSLLDAVEGAEVGGAQHIEQRDKWSAPTAPLAPSAIALVFDAIILACLEQGNFLRGLGFYQEMSIQGLVLHSTASAATCVSVAKDGMVQHGAQAGGGGSSRSRSSSNSSDGSNSSSSGRGLLARLLDQCRTQDELDMVFGSFTDLDDMLMINSASSGARSESDATEHQLQLQNESTEHQLQLHIESTCTALLEACERVGREDWAATLLQQLHALPQCEQHDPQPIVIQLDADIADEDEHGALAITSGGTLAKTRHGEWGVEQAEMLFYDWLCWRSGGNGANSIAAVLPWRTQHDRNTTRR